MFHNDRAFRGSASARFIVLTSRQTANAVVPFVAQITTGQVFDSNHKVRTTASPPLQSHCATLYNEANVEFQQKTLHKINSPFIYLKRKIGTIGNHERRTI